MTASRESLRVLRRSSGVQHPDPTAHDAADPDDGPEARAVQRDCADLLWAAVARLPERQRGLLEALFRGSHDSYREVATACGIPIGSIGPTRARALQLLRQHLGEPDFDLLDA